MQLFVSIIQPYRWARLNRRAELIDQGIFNQLSEAIIYRRDTIVGVVPGEDYLTHQVDVPTRNRKKLTAAIPYVLENSLSEDIDCLEFHIINWQPGRPATVTVFSKSIFDKWRKIAKENKLDLYGIIADYQLLPRLPDTVGSLAKNDNERFCIYFNDNTGTTLDKPSFKLWLQNYSGINEDNEKWNICSDDLVQQFGLSTPKIEYGNHFGAWLKNKQTNQPIDNILKGVIIANDNRSSGLIVKSALSIFMLTGILKIGFDLYELYQLEQKNMAIKSEIKNLLKETFPEVNNIVNASLQLSRQLDSLTQNGIGKNDFLPLLNATTRALISTNARVEELNYKASTLTISCSVVNFAVLDKLKQQLEQQPVITVNLVTSGMLENRVTGRFMISRK